MISKEKEQNLLNEIGVFIKDTNEKAEKYNKYFYILGTFIIVGNATIGICELIFAGDEFVTMVLGSLTLLTGVISPLLVFWGFVKRYKIVVSAHSAAETLLMSFEYSFGVFKGVNSRNERLSKLGEEFSKIKDNYKKGKIEVIEDSSKHLENGKDSN